MSKMNHERFRRRKVYEPDVPVEFQERPQGPSKADLRAQAARAMESYQKPVSAAPAASPARSRPASEPPVVTPASTIPQDLTIECQCGHKATIHRAPADLIGRRLRCTSCGEEPLPF
ncbi:hypothetical protein [Microvirga zambiensis]|uniref:hypothetical protein n=1 Tax=Microvirga zambiensis TaxID=1402137 RepID=UPI00191D09AC|nr:hypothetical protein [Microvirga zambiensis]